MILKIYFDGQFIKTVDSDNPKDSAVEFSFIDPPFSPYKWVEFTMDFRKYIFKEFIQENDTVKLITFTDPDTVAAILYLRDK